MIWENRISGHAIHVEMKMGDYNIQKDSLFLGIWKFKSMTQEITSMKEYNPSTFIPLAGFVKYSTEVDSHD